MPRVERSRPDSGAHLTDWSTRVVPRKKLSTSFLTLALALSVALSHLYGAWHRVAHFGHPWHDIVASPEASLATLDSGKASTGTKEPGAHADALEPGCEAHSGQDHQHSCVSLDGLCTGATPVSSGWVVPTAQPSTFLRTLAAQPLRAHLAWAHARARAPPGISIV